METTPKDTKNASKPIIAYLRVSTQRQGDSGLGLEAQNFLIHEYASNRPIVATYTEVETGTNKKDRPAFKQALDHAQRINATLVVAKLARLSRNVFFTASLMESKVDFVCCDAPYATPLTIHILSAVAEEEARQTSIRTKEALQAYKRRGGLLGSARPECRFNMSEEAMARGRAKGQKARKSKAMSRLSYSFAQQLVGWRRMGLTYGQIAKALNDRGETTTRGYKYLPESALRVVKQAERIVAINDICKEKLEALGM